MRSPFRLSSGPFEAERQGHHEAPNLAAEAARKFGFAGDEIRLAFPCAGVREGQTIGDLATAVTIAAEAGGKQLPSKKLRAAAEPSSVRARVDASTAEFFAPQITQRPDFVLTDAVGDQAVFSGLARFAPLVATIDTPLADTAASDAHWAHHDSPPPA